MYLHCNSPNIARIFFFIPLIVCVRVYLVLFRKKLDSSWQLAEEKRSIDDPKPKKCWMECRDREKAWNMKYLYSYVRTAEWEKTVVAAKGTKKTNWSCAMFVDTTHSDDFNRHNVNCFIFPLFIGYKIFFYCAKKKFTADDLPTGEKHIFRPINLQEIKHNEQNHFMHYYFVYACFFNAMSNETCVIVCYYYNHYGEWIELKYSNNSHCRMLHCSHFGEQFPNIAHINLHQQHQYHRINWRGDSANKGKNSPLHAFC